MQQYLFFIALFYPVIIHLSILSDTTVIAVFVLALLNILQIIVLLVVSRGFHWMIPVQALILCICIFSLFNETHLALFLPPVYLSLILFTIFFHSLHPQKEALISKFARVIFNQNAPDVMIYTRKVTIAWTIFFLLMTIEGLILPFVVSLEVWSVFVNILNYLFIAIFFVIEFTYRRLNFKQKQPLIDSLKMLKTADYRQLFW